MKRAFDRYILKEIASPFAIGLLVYTFTLLINQILILSKTLIAKGATTGTVFKILLYLLPDLFSFTIPMATLMGVLAGMSRLSSDSEIVAFRTMGIPNRQLLKPVLLFSLATWFVSSWLIMFLAPEANYRFSKLHTGVVLSQTISGIKPGIFYQDLPFYSLYFRDQDRGGEWQDVFLCSMKNPEEDTLIFAKKGRFIYKQFQKDNYIVLYDGVVHSFKKKDPLKYSLTFFSRKTEKISNLITIRQTRRSTQLVFPELFRKLRANPGDVLLSLEFHKKFALPFACLALGFLGMSLGISTRKGGKTSGFVISLGIIFIYYVMMTAGRNLILKKVISPFWGSWAPTFFLVAIGIWLYRFSAREKGINWEHFLALRWLGRRKPGSTPEAAGSSKKPLFLRWNPIKILDRYVLRRMFLIFFLVFSSLLLVFYIINILELIDNVIENNIPFAYVLKYDYYATPEIVSIILPISILTAVLLTFSLMSKNNEVTAVQVSGISLFRLALPAVFLGLFLSLATFFIQENILPEANRQSGRMLDVIHKRKSYTDIEFAKNWVLGSENKIYFYNFYEKRRKRFINFNILYLDGEGRLHQRISALSASWQGENTLRLSHGYVRRFKDNFPLKQQLFKEMQLQICENQDYFTQKIKFSGAMNSAELKEYIRFLQKNRSDPLRYQAQLYNNYAFPFSSLVMVFIAIPFSFLMGNRGALFGIGIAVGISMIYWGALGIFSSIGATGVFSPLLSAFAPLVIFSVISGILFLKIKT
ncbi:MAG: LptF/LptG family permease [Candidatus Aminicenantes bacterium]|nr:LptF/LptG family permease [Candidatus Aminicenantes bacterium]